MNILAINGSASLPSSNGRIINAISEIADSSVHIIKYPPLFELPPFRTALTDENVPEVINHLRQTIEEADGIIISTPEYVFSIPSGLKNLLEWCVSTTVLTDKPIAVITASSNGEMGHKELTMILTTLQARVSSETSLLVNGIKSKVSSEGQILDSRLQQELHSLLHNLLEKIAK